MSQCQSCGMPMEGHKFGTEKGGSLSSDYCEYCYRDGEFIADVDMEAMVQFDAQWMADAVPGMTKAQAIEELRKIYPTLKRWKKA